MIVCLITKTLQSQKTRKTKAKKLAINLRSLTKIQTKNQRNQKLIFQLINRMFSKRSIGGPKKKMNSQKTQFSNLVQRIGKELPRTSKTELMFSVCTDGKKCSTHRQLKVHGQRKRMKLFYNQSRNMGLRIGVTQQSICLEEQESSAGKGQNSIITNSLAF